MRNVGKFLGELNELYFMGVSGEKEGQQNYFHLYNKCLVTPF